MSEQREVPIKRYEPGYCEAKSGAIYPGLRECAAGMAVIHADHTALLAERDKRIAELSAELAALQQAWASKVGDGADKITPGEIVSLIEDYQEQLAQKTAECAVWARGKNFVNDAELLASNEAYEAALVEVQKVRDTFAKGLENEEQDCKHAEDERDSLLAQVQRLSASVSDEEAERTYDRIMFNRNEVDALIARRKNA